MRLFGAYDFNTLRNVLQGFFGVQWYESDSKTVVSLDIFSLRFKVGSNFSIWKIGNSNGEITESLLFSTINNYDEVLNRVNEIISKYHDSTKLDVSAFNKAIIGIGKTHNEYVTIVNNKSKDYDAQIENLLDADDDLSITMTNGFNELNTLLGNKADKVSNATNGHLVVLDANGNITDSGVSPSDISSSIFIAEYGVTEYHDILTAINSGKSVLCKTIGLNSYNVSAILPFAYQSHNIFVFTSVSEGNSRPFEYTRALCSLSGVDGSTSWSLSRNEMCYSSHAATTTEHGAGSETNYGHVQLTSSVTQNSGKAITSGAVYTALQNVSDDIDGKQDTLNSNSLAFINKSSSGDASKFLNEQGNFVSVDEIPIQKIVVGQTLQRRNDCLYSYGSANILCIMTGWIERRQSGSAYEMILRSVNTDAIIYIKVLITEQNVVHTVSGINGFIYNIWNLEDPINTDVVLVTYKPNVIFPSFDALLNAVHNRRDVLLVVYLESEAQEYYHLQRWKLYNNDNTYSFVFSTYIHSNHTFKSYVFDYNTGGVLQNVSHEVFSPISSVGTNNINTGAVTNNKIANSTITSEKIASSTIEYGKLHDYYMIEEERAGVSQSEINLNNKNRQGYYTLNASSSSTNCPETGRTALLNFLFETGTNISANGMQVQIGDYIRRRYMSSSSWGEWHAMGIPERERIGYGSTAKTYNLNNYTELGFYFMNIKSSGSSNIAGETGQVVLFVLPFTDKGILQLQLGSHVYRRWRNGSGSWDNWVKLDNA